MNAIRVCLLQSILLVSMLTAVSMAAVAMAQDAKGPYDDAIAKIQQRSESVDQANANNPDVKVWPGVLADRRAKTVTILACATGLKRTDPMEFYVTPVTSGKDYEALTVTPAKPSHVAAALQFIGLKPGLPIDPDKNRFWARGPRLSMRFVVDGKTAINGDAVMLDTRDGKPIAGDLIFAGSFTTTDAQGVKHFAADEADAKSLAPTYEDPAAVLAVPRQAPQSAVYGHQKPAAAVESWTRGQVIDIVFSSIEPGQSEFFGIFKDPMATTLAVRLRAAVGRTEFDVLGPLHGTLGPFVNLPDFVVGVERYAQRFPHDLFTSVTIDDSTSIGEVQKFYAVMAAIEKDRGIKLEPPPNGTLYYRAFLPDEAWRDRSTRLGEPWELFLTRTTDATLTARLERSVENPDRTSTETKIVEAAAPADPAAFAKHVNDHASRWSRTIFIYPPADLTYGELMTWVKPVLATYPRVYVFPAEAPATQPAK